MFEHLILPNRCQLGSRVMKRTNRSNGYAFSATAPANCINKKVQRKGLRAHSSPATLRNTKTWPQRYKRPCLPLFGEARAPCTSYLIGQQRAQSMPPAAAKSRTTLYENRVVTTKLQTSETNETRSIRRAVMIFVPGRMRRGSTCPYCCAANFARALRELSQGWRVPTTPDASPTRP